MKAPDKIYLQICGDCPEDSCEKCKFEALESEATFSVDRIFPKDMEYIRKDVLLEWAKENLFGVCLDCLIEKIESM